MFVSWGSRPWIAPRPLAAALVACVDHGERTCNRLERKIETAQLIERLARRSHPVRQFHIGGGAACGVAQARSRVPPFPGVSLAMACRAQQGTVTLGLRWSVAGPASLGVLPLGRGIVQPFF